MLEKDQYDYWFGLPQHFMTSVPGVTLALPLCKVCGCAVGMGEKDHAALELHIAWHTFGHTQTRPRTW